MAALALLLPWTPSVPDLLCLLFRTAYFPIYKHVRLLMYQPRVVDIMHVSSALAVLAPVFGLFIHLLTVPHMPCKQFSMTPVFYLIKTCWRTMMPTPQASLGAMQLRLTGSLVHISVWSIQ